MYSQGQLGKLKDNQKCPKTKGCGTGRLDHLVQLKKGIFYLVSTVAPSPHVKKHAMIMLLISTQG